jgi:hypothetical protein
MTGAVRFHHPRPQSRLTPQQRRRVPSLGPRPRVAVMSRRGPATLRPDELRRVALRADVTFHTVERAPDLDTATRLLRRVDVLAAVGPCLPVLDPALLERVPQLRAVVLHDGRPEHLDLELLEDHGVGLDVVRAEAWGAHLLAVLDDRPLNPVAWPSLRFPEAS